MDTDSETTGEFARRVFQALVLWFVGSSFVGWVFGSAYGHGGIILLFAAWLLGTVGFLAHLMVLLHLRRKRAA